MTNMVRNVKSTLNFFLAMLELFISIILAIKVFQSDVASENGLAGYIVEIFKTIGGGATFIVDITKISGSVSFLVLVSIVMIFSFALIIRVGQIIGGEQNLARPGRNYKYIVYKRKRFRKNRFFVMH